MAVTPHTLPNSNAAAFFFRRSRPSSLFQRSHRSAKNGTMVRWALTLTVSGRRRPMIPRICGGTQSAFDKRCRRFGLVKFFWGELLHMGTKSVTSHFDTEGGM